MATTTANKGGLRAAATARTVKAAQRTALPPKAEKAAEIKELAAEIAAEDKAAPKKRAPRKSAAQKADEAGAAAAGTARRQAQIEAAMERKRAARQAEDSALTAQVHADAAMEAEMEEECGDPDMEAATAKPARKPRVRKTGEVLAEKRQAEKAPEAAPTGAVTEGTKAHRAAVYFAEAGWDITVTADAEWAEMVARRGAETIHQGWINGVYDHDRSGTYTLADRTVKTRNLSEARKWAARAAETAAAEFRKVNDNKHFRRRAVALSAPKGMPFDLETSSDEEIIKALAGSKVKWHNVYKVEEEDAAIPANSPHTRIVEVPQVGDRPTEKAILFCCPASGFRAFRLSALRRVGRHRV